MTSVQDLNGLLATYHRGRQWMDDPRVDQARKDEKRPAYEALTDKLQVAYRKILEGGAELVLKPEYGFAYPFNGDPTTTPPKSTFKDVTGNFMAKRALGIIAHDETCMPNRGEKANNGSWKYCRVCGGQDWWEQPGDRWICNVCHPHPRRPR